MKNFKLYYISDEYINYLRQFDSKGHIIKIKKDVFKIRDEKLGSLNINNMIPSSPGALIEVLPIIKDEKYKILLIDQLSFLNNQKREIYKKIKNFMLLYKLGYLSQNVLDKCCDFELLKLKCSQYDEI